MLVRDTMRLLGLIATLLVALSCPAETLRELLKANGIPETSFGKIELDENINGAGASEDQIVVVAYMRLDKNNLFTGNPQLVQFNRDSRAVVRSQVKPEDEDQCCGSPEGIAFIGDFVVLSFHINPSAEAMLVLGKDLKLVTTLYGFGAHAVAPDQIVFIEDMIHFAPVHPERLQLADLRSGRKTELYPPKGDALRAEFAREHARHMPAQSTCMQMDDPCKPELYDEDIEFIDEDGHGSFAFTVYRNALHATASEQEPESVASEASLYRYSWNGSAWLYCEEELSDDEAKSRTLQLAHSAGASTLGHCTPTLPAVPDLSNADYSPFDNLRTDKHSRNK